MLLLVDCTKILHNGTNALIRQARDCQKALRFTDGEAIDKFRTYQAVIMAFEAMNTLTGRYSKLAAEMAAKESDPVRRAELKGVQCQAEGLSIPPLSATKAISVSSPCTACLWRTPGITPSPAVWTPTWRARAAPARCP